MSAVCETLDYPSVELLPDLAIAEAVLVSDGLKAYINKACSTPLLRAEQEVELAKRIEAGLYATYKLEANELSPDATMLSRLEAIKQEGIAAKQHMTLANTRLVVDLARKRTRSNLPLPDLIQEGNEGLVHAIKKFDYTLGFKFSTYAVPWIRDYMFKAERRERHGLKELEKHGSLLSLDQIAQENTDVSIGEVVPDSSDMLGDAGLDQALAKVFAIAELTTEERTMFALRSGAVDGRQWTYAEIAQRVGVSKGTTSARLWNIQQRLATVGKATALDVYLEAA